MKKVFFNLVDYKMTIELVKDGAAKTLDVERVGGGGNGEKRKFQLVRGPRNLSHRDQRVLSVVIMSREDDKSSVAQSKNNRHR